MELQYTCGHRQVTQLYPDGKHPHARLELKPGESITTGLTITPDVADLLAIDPTGPIEVTCNEYPRELSRPLIWQRGNGIMFPFGESDQPVTFAVSNPSETETVTVLIVAV
jgi:hypothetical protein